MTKHIYQFWLALNTFRRRTNQPRASYTEAVALYKRLAV